MEVKDIQGKTLIDAPITESAVITEELMKQYSITLGWDAISADVLPLGSYIEHNGVRYSLLAPYNPQQRDETTYEYKPVFEHPVMRWQHLPFFHYTYSGGSIVSKEPDWSLTDNAANFMAAVCTAIQEQTGEDWSYEIADNLPASGDLSFSNTDIFSALTSIAGKFETEWWFDYESKTIYLSKASHGSEVSLEVGRNIGIPSTTQSRDGYATRFYVFGSTRNIEQNYAGSNVNSIVNKRLTLNPAKYPNGYIDIKAGLTNEEILVKTLTFDDIYPRSMLTISNVKVRLMWRLDSDNQKVQIGTDADGKPVYDQYAIWYFKIPGLSFNKDMVISGKALSVHFNDGPLQGREFELTYHDVVKDVETSDGTSIRVDAGDFEINFIEEGTYIIPAMTGLVPVDGNSVSLFNIVMPEEYMASAYEELEKAALKEIAKQGEDMSNYSFSSNAVEFFMSNPALKVGRKVTYKNGDYTYSTRVIKLETQLDRPYEQKITIGNEQIKGNTQTLKEEVVSANQNIDLISAINESTQQLMQSYQRTQKALLDSMSKWGNMWRLDAENNAVYTPLNMIVEGTLSMGDLGQGGSETPVAGLQKVSITIPNYDSPFVSDAAGNVTLPAYPTALKNPYALKINGVTYDGSKEISINIEGGGGIADSVAWENVMGRPTKLSEFENDVPYATESYVTSRGYITSSALNGYATQKWVTDKGYLTSHQDISHLLSKQDAVTTYATITSLNAISDSVSGLRTEFDALNTLLNDDTSGVIDTWNEVVDFLNEYNGSQDLATILAGMNNDIANRVLYTDFEKLEDAVDGIAGYFTNGSANNALKLGGQLPSYYATKSALDTTNGNVVSLTQRMGTAESGISTNKTNIATLITDLSNLTSRVSTAEGTIKGHTDAIALNANNIASNSKSITTNANAITAVSNRVKTFEDVIGIDANGDVYIKGTRNFYTAGGTIGMAGLGSGGSGGGGAAGIVTVRVNGYDYNSVNGIVTLPNYPSLAGYATEKWVTDKGYITASAIPTSLPASDVYAWAKKASLAASDVPNLDWSKITSGKPTTLAGYGISDAFFLHTTSIYLGVRFANGEYATGDKYLEWWNSAGWVNHMSAKYIVAGATSSHFLKGDGSLDNTAYLPLSGGTISGALTLQNSIVVSSGADRKLVLNNTDTESKYQFISFMQEYLEYGKLGTAGTDDLRWNNNIVLHSGNYSSYALPLSGGILSDSWSGGTEIRRKDINNGYASIIFSQEDGTILGRFGFGGVNNPIFVTQAGVYNTLIHSCNIGSYAFIPRADNLISNVNADHYWSNGAYLNQTGNGSGNSNFPNNYAMFLSFNNGASKYVTQFDMGRGAAYYRTKIDSWSRWYQFITDENIGSQSVSYATSAGNANSLNGISSKNYAYYSPVSGYLAFNINDFTLAPYGQGDGYIEYYDNGAYYNSVWGWVMAIHGFKGNADSATKLQTARTIWGQSFDGTGNVDGKIYQDGKWILGCHTDGNLYIGFDTYSTNDTLIYGRNLYFGTYSGYSMLINSSGNVLIGTTTDNGNRLQVDGGGYIARFNNYSGGDSGILLSRASNTAWGIVVSGGNLYLKDNTSGTTRLLLYENSQGGGAAFAGSLSVGGNTNITGNLTATGGATFGGDVYSEGTMAMARLTSSSDAKLKENIKWLSVDRAMEVVRALRPTEWDWKKDHTHSFGFIAQDVQPIIPEMVSSVNDTLRLEYNQLHAFEIGAIQHIDSEVETLKKDLKTANNRIEVLENELNKYRRTAQWQ